MPSHHTLSSLSHKTSKPVKHTCGSQTGTTNTPGLLQLHKSVQFADGLNKALLRPAYQSSSYEKKDAGLAVDGDIQSHSHTDRNDHHPWWKIELASLEWVTDVEIANRQYRGEKISFFGHSWNDIMLTGVDQCFANWVWILCFLSKIWCVSNTLNIFQISHEISVQYMNQIQILGNDTWIW